jgi:hypothetical protein
VSHEKSCQHRPKTCKSCKSCTTCTTCKCTFQNFELGVVSITTEHQPSVSTGTACHAGATGRLQRHWPQKKGPNTRRADTPRHDASRTCQSGPQLCGYGPTTTIGSPFGGLERLLPLKTLCSKGRKSRTQTLGQGRGRATRISSHNAVQIGTDSRTCQAKGSMPPHKHKHDAEIQRAQGRHTNRAQPGRESLGTISLCKARAIVRSMTCRLPPTPTREFRLGIRVSSIRDKHVG